MCLVRQFKFDIVTQLERTEAVYYKCVYFFPSESLLDRETLHQQRQMPVWLH